MALCTSGKLILLDFWYCISRVVRKNHPEAFGLLALDWDAMKGDNQLGWIHASAMIDVRAVLVTSHAFFIVNDQVLPPEQHALKLDGLGELDDRGFAVRRRVAPGGRPETATHCQSAEYYERDENKAFHIGLLVYGSSESRSAGSTGLPLRHLFRLKAKRIPEHDIAVLQAFRAR